MLHATMMNSSNYGPFTSLVATAGAIIAAGGAIGLGFKKRARWEPSEQDVSQGPQRVGSLVAAVGIVLIWANSRPDQITGLTHLAIWLLALTVAALIVYGLLNATLVYEVEVAIDPDRWKEQKIIGGYWFGSGIPEKIKSAGVTTQDFLKGTGYKIDSVWPRLSRALAKQTFVVAYLVLTVCGTVALAVASIITGFKTGH